MSLSSEQKLQLEKLIDYRNDIVDILANIQGILQQHFPEEFDSAYQHYIPQIITALYSDTRWLPRGAYSMQNTINNLQDKAQENNYKGVSKFI